MRPAFRSLMTLAMVCGITLAAGVFAFRAQAGLWDKRTVLTVDQTIQIRNTVLEPGSYVLRLADIGSERHIVQIFTSDERHIIDTVMAIPNYRLQPTGDSQFLFWETPPGSAKALRAWFYPGDNFGQEFPYPKELRQLASYQPAPALAPVPPPPPAPPVETQPQAEVQQPEPVVIAQNNTPAPPPPQEVTPAPEPPPAPSQAPETLPKTASLYPLMGLGGVLSLGFFGLLRLKRPA